MTETHLTGQQLADMLQARSKAGDRWSVPSDVVDQVLSYLRRPPVEFVYEYRQSEQNDLMRRVAEIMRGLLDKLDALGDESPLWATHQVRRSDIQCFEFGTGKGYFFTAYPSLIVETDTGNGESTEKSIPWGDLFDYDDADELDDLTGDLTDAFGPVGAGDTLRIDPEGMAWEN